MRFGSANTTTKRNIKLNNLPEDEKQRVVSEQVLNKAVVYIRSMNRQFIRGVSVISTAAEKGEVPCDYVPLEITNEVTNIILQACETPSEAVDQLIAVFDDQNQVDDKVQLADRVKAAVNAELRKALGLPDA